MSAKVGIQKIYDELHIYGITKYDISGYTDGGIQLSDMGRFGLTLLGQPVDRINELFYMLNAYGIEKVFAHTMMKSMHGLMRKKKRSLKKMNSTWMMMMLLLQKISDT